MLAAPTRQWPACRLRWNAAARPQVQVRVTSGAGAPASMGLWVDGARRRTCRAPSRLERIPEPPCVTITSCGANGQLGPWRASELGTWTLDAAAHGEGGRRARLLVVVIDAVTGATIAGRSIGLLGIGRDGQRGERRGPKAGGLPAKLRAGRAPPPWPRSNGAPADRVSSRKPPGPPWPWSP